MCKILCFQPRAGLQAFYYTPRLASVVDRLGSQLALREGATRGVVCRSAGLSYRASRLTSSRRRIFRAQVRLLQSALTLLCFTLVATLLPSQWNVWFVAGCPRRLHWRWVAQCVSVGVFAFFFPAHSTVLQLPRALVLACPAVTQRQLSSDLCKTVLGAIYRKDDDPPARTGCRLLRCTDSARK